jgi:hypothetical protein
VRNIGLIKVQFDYQGREGTNEDELKGGNDVGAFSTLPSSSLKYPAKFNITTFCKGYSVFLQNIPFWWEDF